MFKCFFTMCVYLLFLCVLQLIARLKRENQALKEELVMMAGKPREDQLTVEEIQKYVTSCSFNPSHLST